MNGTSVINPMIFYWMDVALGIEFITGLLATAFLVVTLLWLLYGGDECNNLSEFIKPLIGFLIPTVVFAILTVLIPSKETMITMLVADMITYENIELTKDSAMALVNYIVEQVKVITG